MKPYLLATCFLAVTITSASAGTIILTNSNPNPYVGSTFNISLSVSGNTGEIIGFGLNFAANNPGITFQSFGVHPFFTDISPLMGTAVSAIAFPGAITASVDLVTFTYLAQTVGNSIFSVTSDPLNNLDQGLFQLTVPGGLPFSPTGTIAQTLQVDVQAVPEPSTVGLAALAVGGMWMGRRRRA